MKYRKNNIRGHHDQSRNAEKFIAPPGRTPDGRIFRPCYGTEQIISQIHHPTTRFESQPIIRENQKSYPTRSPTELLELKKRRGHTSYCNPSTMGTTKALQESFVVTDPVKLEENHPKVEYHPMAESRILFMEKPKLNRRRSMPDLTEYKCVSSASAYETVSTLANIQEVNQLVFVPTSISQTYSEMASILRKVPQINLNGEKCNKLLSGAESNISDKYSGTSASKENSMNTSQQKLDRKNWIAKIGSVNEMKKKIFNCNTVDTGVQTDFGSKPTSRSGSAHRNTNKNEDSESVYYDSLEEDEIETKSASKNKAFYISIDGIRDDASSIQVELPSHLSARIDRLRRKKVHTKTQELIEELSCHSNQTPRQLQTKGSNYISKAAHDVVNELITLSSDDKLILSSSSLPPVQEPSSRRGSGRRVKSGTRRTNQGSKDPHMFPEIASSSQRSSFSGHELGSDILTTVGDVRSLGIQNNSDGYRSENEQSIDGNVTFSLSSNNTIARDATFTVSSDIPSDLDVLSSLSNDEGEKDGSPSTNITEVSNDCGNMQSKSYMRSDIGNQHINVGSMYEKCAGSDSDSEDEEILIVEKLENKIIEKCEIKQTGSIEAPFAESQISTSIISKDTTLHTSVSDLNDVQENRWLNEENSFTESSIIKEDGVDIETDEGSICTESSGRMTVIAAGRSSSSCRSLDTDSPCGEDGIQQENTDGYNNISTDECSGDQRIEHQDDKNKITLSNDISVDKESDINHSESELESESHIEHESVSHSSHDISELIKANLVPLKFAIPETSNIHHNSETIDVLKTDSCEQKNCKNETEIVQNYIEGFENTSKQNIENNPRNGAILDACNGNSENTEKESTKQPGEVPAEMHDHEFSPPSTIHTIFKPLTITQLEQIESEPSQHDINNEDISEDTYVPDAILQENFLGLDGSVTSTDDSVCSLLSTIEEEVENSGSARSSNAFSDRSRTLEHMTFEGSDEKLTETSTFLNNSEDESVQRPQMDDSETIEGIISSENKITNQERARTGHYELESNTLDRNDNISEDDFDDDSENIVGDEDVLESCHEVENSDVLNSTSMETNCNEIYVHDRIVENMELTDNRSENIEAISANIINAGPDIQSGVEHGKAVNLNNLKIECEGFAAEVVSKKITEDTDSENFDEGRDNQWNIEKLNKATNVGNRLRESYIDHSDDQLSDGIAGVLGESYIHDVIDKNGTVVTEERDKEEDDITSQRSTSSSEIISAEMDNEYPSSKDENEVTNFAISCDNGSIDIIYGEEEQRETTIDTNEVESLTLKSTSDKDIETTEIPIIPDAHSVIPFSSQLDNTVEFSGENCELLRSDVNDESIEIDVNNIRYENKSENIQEESLHEKCFGGNQESFLADARVHFGHETTPNSTKCSSNAFEVDTINKSEQNNSKSLEKHIENVEDLFDDSCEIFDEIISSTEEDITEDMIAEISHTNVDFDEEVNKKYLLPYERSNKNHRVKKTNKVSFLEPEYISPSEDYDEDDNDIIDADSNSDDDSRNNDHCQSVFGIEDLDDVLEESENGASNSIIMESSTHSEKDITHKVNVDYEETDHLFNGEQQGTENLVVDECFNILAHNIIEDVDTDHRDVDNDTVHQLTDLTDDTLQIDGSDEVVDDISHHVNSVKSADSAIGSVDNTEDVDTTNSVDADEINSIQVNDEIEVTIKEESCGKLEEPSYNITLQRENRHRESQNILMRGNAIEQKFLHNHEHNKTNEEQDQSENMSSTYPINEPLDSLRNTIQEISTNKPQLKSTNKEDIKSDNLLLEYGYECIKKEISKHYTPVMETGRCRKAHSTSGKARNVVEIISIVSASPPNSPLHTLHGIENVSDGNSSVSSQDFGLQPTTSPSTDSGVVEMPCVVETVNKIKEVLVSSSAENISTTNQTNSTSNSRPASSVRSLNSTPETSKIRSRPQSSKQNKEKINRIKSGHRSTYKWVQSTLENDILEDNSDEIIEDDVIYKVDKTYYKQRTGTEDDHPSRRLWEPCHPGTFEAAVSPSGSNLTSASNSQDSRYNENESPLTVAEEDSHIHIPDDEESDTRQSGKFENEHAKLSEKLLKTLESRRVRRHRNRASSIDSPARHYKPASLSSLDFLLASLPRYQNRNEPQFNDCARSPLGRTDSNELSDDGGEVMVQVIAGRQRPDVKVTASKQVKLLVQVGGDEGSSTTDMHQYSMDRQNYFEEYSLDPHRERPAYSQRNMDIRSKQAKRKYLLLSDTNMIWNITMIYLQ